MTDKRGVLCLVLLITGISLCAAGQGRFELKYAEVEKNHPIALLDLANMSLMSREPTELKKKPAGLSNDAAYLITRIMRQRLCFVIEPNLDKPKLWVDTDMDGDLAEEKAIVGKKSGPDLFVDFGSFIVNVPYSGGTCRFLLGLTGYIGGDDPEMDLSQRLVRSGIIEAEGKMVKIEIADTDLDGRYISYARVGVPMKTDSIAFAVIPEKGGVPALPTIQPLSTTLRIGDNYYELRLPADASVVEVQKIDLKYGILDVGCPYLEMRLKSTLGEFSLEPNSSGKWKLPVGQYTAVQIALVRIDEKGNEHRLRWSDRGGKFGVFEIAEGRVTSIPAGSPLTVSARTTVYGKRASVGMSLKGRAGEEYSPGVYDNGEQRPAPKFKICGKDGSVIANGSFEYG